MSYDDFESRSRKQGLPRPLGALATTSALFEGRVLRSSLLGSLSVPSKSFQVTSKALVSISTEFYVKLMHIGTTLSFGFHTGTM